MKMVLSDIIGGQEDKEIQREKGREIEGEVIERESPVRGELRRSSFVATSISGSLEMGTHTSVV